MERSYIGLALGALVTVGMLLGVSSCGHPQKLVGLQVTPPSVTFPLPYAGATAQFHAIGTYIHPPATKDVTTQASWRVDDSVVTVVAGFVTTTGGCGSTNVTATMPEGTGGASNIVIASAFVTVKDPNNPNCPK
jgi:hypothetical protein